MTATDRSDLANNAAVEVENIFNSVINTIMGENRKNSRWFLLVRIWQNLSKPENKLSDEKKSWYELKKERDKSTGKKIDLKQNKNDGKKVNLKAKAEDGNSTACQERVSTVKC